MQIYDQSEAFVERDGDLEFAHTKVILRDGNRFFYTTSNHRCVPTSTFNTISPSNLTEIPTDRIWPEINFQYTSAPDPLPPNCYIKQPRLIEYDDTVTSLNMGTPLLQEAKICEILRSNPHPNIARFFGCIVEGKRLKGLCFAKYPVTLREKVKELTPMDIGSCLDGIEEGIHHLHGLGLIHNDLNPSNIMMDGDVPVIIDFDSCRFEGTRLGAKAGTLGWDSCETDFAARENDLKALSRIREFLTRTRNAK